MFELGLHDIGKVSTLNAYIDVFNDENIAKLSSYELRRTISTYIGQLNRYEIIFKDVILPSINASLPDIFDKTAVIDTPEGSMMIIYDFDTLKDDIHYRTKFANIVDRQQIIYDRTRAFLQDSKNMQEALRAYQKDLTIMAVSFQ